MEQRADIRIYNEDCLPAMKKMADNEFDLAIVDPPYRDSVDNDMNQSSRKYIDSGRLKDWNDRPTKAYFDEIVRVSKNQIIWGANNFSLPQFKGFIVWDKVMPFDFTMSMAEIASISDGLGTISKIYKLRVAGMKDRIHPTQKPVQLYKWLLQNYAKEGDKILDTHFGSGSIAIACWDLGFDLVGYEIDKDYYDAAVKRLENHKAQIQLF